MICDSAAEYVSRSVTGKPSRPQRLNTSARVTLASARLKEYLAFAVDLRLTASRELREAVAPLSWSTPQNRVAAVWQKGWEP